MLPFSVFGVSGFATVDIAASATNAANLHREQARYIGFVSRRIALITACPFIAGGHPRTWISVVSPMLQFLQYQIKIFQDLNERLAAAWEYKIEQATAGRGLIIGGHRVPASIQPKHWNRDWKLQNGHDTSKSSLANGADRQSAALSLERLFYSYLPAFITDLWMGNPLIGHEILWADLTMQLWNIEGKLFGCLLLGHSPVLWITAPVGSGLVCLDCYIACLCSERVEFQ